MFVTWGTKVQEQSREQSAPEVKGPLPFLLEPLTVPQGVVHHGQSFDLVPTGS